MHVRTRVLAAVAAGALLPLGSASAASAQTAAEPAPVSTADVCQALSASTFTDAAGAFTQQIECLALAGITTGGPSGLPADAYGPGLPVRRDAMASFLARLVDTAGSLAADGASVTPLPEPDSDAAFVDVADDSVHARAIGRLAAAGIVQGGPNDRPDDQFGPELVVTRAQTATLVRRTLEFAYADDLSVDEDYFGDDDGLVAHEDSINALAALGVVAGRSADVFDPFGPVRRDQMAAFLVRALAVAEADGVIAYVTPLVQLLGITDFHGHLDPSSSGPSVAGRLAGAVDGYRALSRNTAFASAGDNVGASPFLSAVAQDQPSLDVLDAMGLDVSAVGNHELDKGFDDLVDRIVPAAGFPYLAANVEGDDGALDGSAVLTTTDGVRIGFIGVVTEQTASLVAPSGIEGLTFTDPVEAANREAEALADEADVIVLLAHEGSETAGGDAEQCAAIGTAQDAFGEIVRDVDPAVDVILGGHTHVRVDCAFPTTGKGDVRPVLQAGEYGRSLARLTFRYDPVADAITAVDGEVVQLTAEAFPGTDADVEAIVAEAQANAEELGAPVIGTITDDITRAVTADGSEDRGSESVLGNFIADVQLDAVNQPGRPGAQIAFMNPGGLRDDFRCEDVYADETRCEVTFGEAGAVQPFGNTLFTLTLTGAQVDQVLEEQYQPEGASRPFLALGVSEGLFFVQDDAAPEGERISGITLDGEPIDPLATYGVVTNSFLASGGDNFSTLAEGTDRTDTGLNDLDALVQFFERQEGPIAADTASRRQDVG